MLVFNDIKTKTFIALLISGIFLVFVYLGAYFSGNASFSRVFIFQFTMVMLVGFCVIFTYVSIATAVIRLLNKRQIIYNNWKRWLIELLMIGVISVMVTLLMVEQIPPFIEPPVIDTLEKRFAPIFLPNFLFGIIIFAVVEVWTIFQQNRDLQLTLTKVEKEKVISQLAGLQQKINPHFLFNSLSVLSELVYENPKKADAFIREFTKVYRYVLDFNVETVVTVEKELEFLNAYLFLQKIRFGESLEIEKKIDGEVLNKYIPPLSLQLLFENAIKHNRVSKAEPLIIHLKNNNRQLIVTNNLQSRLNVTNSKGVGLSNLKKTYNLISEEQPEFYKNEIEFVAKLPLIERI